MKDVLSGYQNNNGKTVGETGLLQTSKLFITFSTIIPRVLTKPP